MLKICRADCKHYTSDARCGKTIGDKRRGEPPSYDLRELRDAKCTADGGDPHKHNLIERKRNVYSARSAADDTIHKGVRSVRKTSSLLALRLNTIRITSPTKCVLWFTIGLRKLGKVTIKVQSVSRGSITRHV